MSRVLLLMTTVTSVRSRHGKLPQHVWDAYIDALNEPTDANLNAAMDCLLAWGSAEAVRKRDQHVDEEIIG